MNDKILKKLIAQDFAGVPDPETELRLQRAFILRSAGYKTRQNSFSGFFGWLFTPRQVFAKMAFAVIITAFFFIRPGLNTSRHLPVVIDSTGIDQSGVQDSAFLRLPGRANNDSVF
ncbi:MAG: hypothetical protein AAGU19_14475 [Prolixibacteraceae bacterium]